MSTILGWLNVILLGVVAAPYIIDAINKHFIKSNGTALRGGIKTLKKFHKPFGVVLLLTAPIHGFLELGKIPFHTGSVLFIVIVITELLGGLFYKFKKRPLFSWHKRIAFLVITLLLIHILYPDAVEYIRN